MRRTAVIFLLVLVALLLFALHSVSTLIALLFEDASLDAIRLDELPAYNNLTFSPSDPLPPLTSPQIPRIIHQTYINTTIPDRWLSAQQSCIALHTPDYEYHLWTDAESVSFIAEQYPWFLDTFVGYKHPIQRADAIRYFVLRHYGGIYIDLDDGCARRLDPLLGFSAFVRRTIPTGISNDVMGAVPNHPFFVRVTESLRGADRSWVLPYITIMASTGPLFLSVAWKRWMGEHAGLAPEGGEWEGRVRVLMPPEYSGRAGWSWFNTFKGDSWHGDDARFIFWLGRNWVLVTAVGFGVATLLGVVCWVLYSRVVGVKGGGGRKNLKRRSSSNRTVMSRSVSPASEDSDFSGSSGGGSEGGYVVAWAQQPSSPQLYGGGGGGGEKKVPWWRRTVLGGVIAGAAMKGKGPYELVEQHDA